MSIPDVEVLPAMNGTGQLIALGTQLAEALVSRLREPAGVPDDAEAAERAAPDAAQLARAFRRVARRNAQLSRALGACRCWGLNPRCLRCGGAGRAGFYPLDPGAFAAFVAPAIVAEPEAFLAVLAENAEEEQPT